MVAWAASAGVVLGIIPSISSSNKLSGICSCSTSSSSASPEGGWVGLLRPSSSYGVIGSINNKKELLVASSSWRLPRRRFGAQGVARAAVALDGEKKRASGICHLAD